MQHAVLGAGGVGGLIAGALARAGEQVVLVLRPESAARYEGRLRVESVMLGDFDVAVPASVELERAVDVLWVATKATQLEAALSRARAEVVGDAVVVPLLNGVDHVKALRARFRNVVAAAIRVESERSSPGPIRQKSPFLRVDLAGQEPVQAVLREAGIDCRACEDEAAVLWEKLVFLAPIALGTAAFDAPVGRARDEPAFSGCRAEAVAAARAAGVDVDLDAIRNLHEATPAESQSSMQKDVAAGREPELAAIAGPIVRLGRETGFSTASTEFLTDAIEARLR